MISYVDVIIAIHEPVFVFIAFLSFQLSSFCLDYDSYTNLNPVYSTDGDATVSGNDPDNFGRYLSHACMCVIMGNHY